MADYAPLYDEGDEFTLTASAPIVGGQLCRITGSGTVGPAVAATPDWCGVAAQDVGTGARVMLFAHGIQWLTATGAITAGQTVEAAAAGTVAPHTNGTADANIVGLALTSAANGAAVQVKFNR